MSGTDYSEFWKETLEEPYRNYWQALGQFIDQFAHVEQHLQDMLRHYAATSDEVGRVVFSGHRVKDGVDTINRLLDARGLPRPKARLKHVFHQLGEINTTRNNIVHWGVTHDWAGAMGATVSNRHLVQPGRTEQRYLVTLGDLADMIADLIKIGIHLQLEMYQEAMPRTLYRKLIRQALNGAWSYKPPQRSAPPRRSRRDPPE